MLIPAADTLVTPNLALLAWTLFGVTGLIGTVITLAKGRPGLALICLITGGLLGNVTGWLAPRPGSFWIRRRRRRAVAKTRSRRA